MHPDKDDGYEGLKWEMWTDLELGLKTKEAAVVDGLNFYKMAWRIVDAWTDWQGYQVDLNWFAYKADEPIDERAWRAFTVEYLKEAYRLGKKHGLKERGINHVAVMRCPDLKLSLQVETVVDGRNSSGPATRIAEAWFKGFKYTSDGEGIGYGSWVALTVESLKQAYQLGKEQARSEAA